MRLQMDGVWRSPALWSLARPLAADLRKKDPKRVNFIDSLLLFGCRHGQNFGFQGLGRTPGKCCQEKRNFQAVIKSAQRSLPQLVLDLCTSFLVFFPGSTVCMDFLRDLVGLEVSTSKSESVAHCNFARTRINRTRLEEKMRQCKIKKANVCVCIYMYTGRIGSMCPSRGVLGIGSMCPSRCQK